MDSLTPPEVPTAIVPATELFEELRVPCQTFVSVGEIVAKSPIWRRLVPESFT